MTATKALIAIALFCLGTALTFPLYLICEHGMKNTLRPPAFIRRYLAKRLGKKLWMEAKQRANVRGELS